MMSGFIERGMSSDMAAPEDGRAPASTHYRFHYHGYRGLAF
jgi:hypothetical protein